jgi:hypothetical protein
MIFIFAVIVLVAVSLVAAVVQMNSHTPVVGVYSNNTTAPNQTGQMINTMNNMAPNLMIPAIFVSLALVLIGVLFLFKRR